jgi:hypothetical protein
MTISSLVLDIKSFAPGISRIGKNDSFYVKWDNFLYPFINLGYDARCFKKIKITDFYILACPGRPLIIVDISTCYDYPLNRKGWGEVYQLARANINIKRRSKND